MQGRQLETQILDDLEDAVYHIALFLQIRELPTVKEIVSHLNVWLKDETNQVKVHLSDGRFQALISVQNNIGKLRNILL